MLALPYPGPPGSYESLLLVPAHEHHGVHHHLRVQVLLLPGLVASDEVQDAGWTDDGAFGVGLVVLVGLGPEGHCLEIYQEGAFPGEPRALLLKLHDDTARRIAAILAMVNRV